VLCGKKWIIKIACVKILNILNVPYFCKNYSIRLAVLSLGCILYHLEALKNLMPWLQTSSIKLVSPGVGASHLYCIKSPRCFCYADKDESH
jgi:hypothetical protein